MSANGEMGKAPPPLPTNIRAILLATFVAFGELLALPSLPSSDVFWPGGFLFGYDIGVISARLIPLTV